MNLYHFIQGVSKVKVTLQLGNWAIHLEYKYLYSPTFQSVRRKLFSLL